MDFPTMCMGSDPECLPFLRWVNVSCLGAQGHYPLFGTATQYGVDAGAYPGNSGTWANVSPQIPFCTIRHTILAIPAFLFSTAGKIRHSMLKCMNRA